MGSQRELAVQGEGLGIEEEFLGDQHELEPDGVGVELPEGQVRQAAVLGGADAVLDARAGAMAALQGGDALAGAVGEDRLEAVAVVVGERELRAGVRALAAHDHPGALRPGGQVGQVGDLADLPVVARPAVLIERRRPDSSRARIAVRTGPVRSNPTEKPMRAARHIRLRLPRTWPWAGELAAAFARLAALPAP